MRWVFLRHGESTANAQGFVAGWVDVPLTPVGEAQAVAAGRELAHEPIELVLCSDLGRARHTAALALAAWCEASGRPAPPLELEPALRERNIGAWERERIQQLRDDGRIELMLSWDGRPPGGESHLDIATRALPALSARERNGVVLVVSHGGTIRTLLGLVDGVPLPQIGRNGVANATAIARELPHGTWMHVQRRLGLPVG